MALVKQRRGTVQSRKVAILWRERGLQVGRVINSVRPGIGREEFVMTAETLAQVGAETMVDGTSIGVVGVHVPERNAVSKADTGITTGGEPFSLQNSICQSDTPSTPWAITASATDGFRPRGGKNSPEPPGHMVPGGRSHNHSPGMDCQLAR